MENRVPLNWKFGLIHWFTTVILAPIIPTVFDWIDDKEGYFLPWFFLKYLVGVVIALVISVPALAIYFATFWYISSRSLNVNQIKTILISVLVLGIYITLLCMGKGEVPRDLYYALACFAASATAVGIFLDW